MDAIVFFIDDSQKIIIGVQIERAKQPVFCLYLFHGYLLFSFGLPSVIIS